MPPFFRQGAKKLLYKAVNTSDKFTAIAPEEQRRLTTTDFNSPIYKEFRVMCARAHACLCFWGALALGIWAAL